MIRPAVRRPEMLRVPNDVVKTHSRSVNALWRSEISRIIPESP